MPRLCIKEIAESQGLNRSQLQLKSGVTFPMLNRYWSNSTESIVLKQLGKIASALGVKTRDLIVEEEDAVTA